MGDIHMLLLERLAACARPAECLLQASRLHYISAGAIGLQNPPEFVHIGRLAIRSQCHHLVLVRRVKKTQVAGDVFIQQAERMRQVDLAQPLVLAPGIVTTARAGPLTAAIHHEHGSIFVWAGKEGAGFMGQVMVHEPPTRHDFLNRHPGESDLQMMWSTVGQLPGRIHYIRQK